MLATMNRKSRNSYIASICRSTGETDPHRAVAKHVKAYRQPGMTIEEIVRGLGVSEVVEEKLDFDGGVFSSGTNLIIKINSSSHPTRRRFTLAHELAHLIISAENAQSARRCLKSNPLEDACDFVAAELLMPMEEVNDRVEKRASIESLRSFAQRFNVSFQAAAVRIKELGMWKESIGRWKWNGSTEQLWYVGQRFWRADQVPNVVFERAMKYNSFVGSWEFYHDARGPREVHFKLERWGQDQILGLVRG